MLTKRRFAACAICAAVGLVATGVEAGAQNPGGLTRTILRRTDFPGDKYATIQVLVDIDPNFQVPRHTHPGVEAATVLEGGGELFVRGQPDRKLGAGDAFQVPAETPHGVRNGPARTRLAVVYVVEKDKPLASPAPE
jgi:quercetin dioxygenase-like cupin family protein